MASAVMYTDGSCLQGANHSTGENRRRGRGGYAAVVEVGHEGWVVRGHVPSTTNTAMELLAVIAGLRSLEQYDCPVVVWTDCAGMFRRVQERWRAKELTGFVRSRHARPHYDEWVLLAALFELRLVVFRQVPAHPAAEYTAHQRAHKFARLEARQQPEAGAQPSKRERRTAREQAVAQRHLLPHLRAQGRTAG